MKLQTIGKLLVVILVISFLPNNLLEAQSGSGVPMVGKEQIVIKLKDVISEKSAERAQKIVEKHATVKAIKIRQTKVAIKNKKNTNLYALEIEGVSLQILAELKSDPEIEFAQWNYLYEPDLTPNDPSYSLQWAHPISMAPSGWDITTGNPSVVVAAIGTGVKWDHVDLANNIWTNTDEVPDNTIDDDGNGYADDVRGWNFSASNNNPQDGNGHETSVAGVIAAQGNNSLGIAGVCWVCKIMPLKVDYTTLDVAEAIDYAVDNGAKVVNMSFGNYDISKYGTDTIVEQAINNGLANGVMMISTAGNDSVSTKRYPAALPQVIAVSSIDSSSQRSSFSNYGEWVDVAAPGTSILSTNMLGGYSSVNGTSFSAPYVAGLAGLMFSQYPTLSLADARLKIEYSTEKLSTDKYIGSGRVSVSRTLASGTRPIIFSIIKKPWNNETFPANSVIEIWGTALGDSYELQYRDSIQIEWTDFATGSEVVNGTLGFLDANSLSLSGWAMVRLVTHAGLETDSHTATLFISSPVPVDTVSPTVTLTQPLDGSSVNAPLMMSANASDDRAVTKVEFYLDGLLRSWDTTSPYSTLMPITNGPHTGYAKAYDMAGNTATSSTASFTVDDTIPPTITLTAPADGTSTSSPVNLTATASDNVSVSRVEFYADNNLLGSDTSFPYTITADLAAGNHVSYAKAFDTSNNTSNSTSINFSVLDVIDPVATLVSPLDNSSVNSPISISGSATDNLGVVLIELYVDGAKIGSASSSFHTLSYTLSAGPHSAFAKAYDAAGNSATSSSVSFTVLDTTSPTVAIISPLNNSQVNRNTTVTISANASDNVAIQKIEFYVNNSLKCTDTSSAYSCTWLVPHQKNEVYTLRANAFDVAGNTTQSSLVTVTSR